MVSFFVVTEQWLTLLHEKRAVSASSSLGPTASRKSLA